MNRYHRDLIAKMHTAAHALDHIARTWPHYRDTILGHAPGISATRTDTNGRASGISDPTGHAATTERPDPITTEARRIETLLARVLLDITDISRTIDHTVNPTPPAQRDRPVTCRQIGCDTVLETKLSDYSLTADCPACHRWLIEHDATTVPARVLANRQAKRDHDARRRTQEEVTP